MANPWYIPNYSLLFLIISPVGLVDQASSNHALPEYLHRLHTKVKSQENRLKPILESHVSAYTHFSIQNLGRPLKFSKFRKNPSKCTNGYTCKIALILNYWWMNAVDLKIDVKHFVHNSVYFIKFVFMFEKRKCCPFFWIRVWITHFNLTSCNEMESFLHQTAIMMMTI